MQRLLQSVNKIGKADQCYYLSLVEYLFYHVNIIE